MNGKITLTIVRNADQIRRIPDMNARNIRIVRLSGEALNDKQKNILVKNQINQHHFHSELPLAMYNPVREKEPLFVIGGKEDIADLLKELRAKHPELVTDEKVRIDHPSTVREKADLLNLYLKYLAVSMFDTQHVSITADKGLAFLQHKGKSDDVMISVYFREKDGNLVLRTSSSNVYRVKKNDAKDYYITFSKVREEFGGFQLKTFSESANIQRYRKKGRSFGTVKSTHLAFTGSEKKDMQWQTLISGASVGACVAQVVKMLRDAGIEIQFQEVDSVSCGFGYSAKQGWQKAETARMHEVIARRIIEDGLWVRKTDSVSNEQFEVFFKAVKEAFSSSLSCVLFTDTMGKKEKGREQEVNIRFGPVPEGVLSAYGMVTRKSIFRLPESDGYYCDVQRSQGRNNGAASYRKIKEVELRCIPGTDQIHLPVTIEENLEFGIKVHDIDGIPSGEWSREVYDHVTKDSGKYELILQKDESDEQYDPALNRQYVTLESILDADPKEMSSMLKTCIRELLCVKADLLEKWIASSARDLSGISLFWHEHLLYGKAWKKKIAVGKDNAIADAPFTDAEALLSSAMEKWAVLTLPDGRSFHIHHAKELRQIIAPMKEENTVLSRSLKSADSDYIRNVKGNIGFQHFDFEGKQYYLIGYDDSKGLQQTYAFYPCIYEVSREDGEQLSDQDWYDLVRLCYTPLVSSQRNASVYPFLKKYIDEQIRVMPEYQEAKKTHESDDSD